MSGVLSRIDSRISELQAARQVLVELEAERGGAAPRESKRIKQLRAKLSGASGTSKVVLEAIRAGANTIVAIAKAAKVKDGVARAAVKALEDAGWIARDGKTWPRRYRTTK